MAIEIEAVVVLKGIVDAGTKPEIVSLFSELAALSEMGDPTPQTPTSLKCHAIRGS